MKKLIGILLILLTTFAVEAQFYETGQEPAHIHWRQIKTGYFRLVYPDYAEKQAQNFARKLMWAARRVPEGLHHQPKRIDILMHMESATSNAMVVWAPKRMETHNTPPQDSYGEDWWEQLALHEFRHVVQVSKMRQGFTKVLSFVFGEAATGGLFGAYIPLWFIEGDAVAVETALSQTGRGRDPNFSMDLKAQLLEKGKYTYDKAYNGSYRNYIPDHYTLGYHITTLAKQKYGNDFWSNTLDYSARNPYLIVPFSHSLKKQSGMVKTRFYSRAMDDLIQIWSQKQEQLKCSGFDTLVINQSKYFRSFLFPHKINQREIVCLSRGLDDIDRIVKIDITNQKITKLHSPGYGKIDNLAYANGLLVWNERTYDPRWQHRKYMILKTYDLQTGKVKKISKRSRYFYPNLDREGKRIVTVEVDIQNRYRLLILDARSGQILDSISAPTFIKTPAFGAGGNSILAIEITKNGNTLVRYSLKGHHKEILYGPTFDNISKPIAYGDKILFISTQSGVANVFSLDQKGKISQITSVPYGVDNISLTKNNQLIFNSYSSDGFLIASQKVKALETTVNIAKDDFYKSYFLPDSSNIQAQTLPDTLFASSKYHKTAHLFNLHSWGPVGLDIDNMKANPGFTIASQNLLTTMISTFGYEYRLNEQTGRYWAKLSYKGWYPVFDLNLEYEDRAGKDERGNRFTYNMTTLGLNIKQGLNLTAGKYSNYLYAAAGINSVLFGANPSTPENFPVGSKASYLQYRLYFHHKLKRGYRDMDTRWGQSFDFIFRNGAFDDLIGNSSLSYAALRLYFPGIGSHHTQKIYIALQSKNKSGYQFSDIIRLPRSYTGIMAQDIISFQYDYMLPLFCPDFSLGSLVYFKRFKTALFYDYSKTTAYNNGPGVTTIYQSAGLDLKADVHFLRHTVAFTIGLRTAYLINYDKPAFQFLYSVSF